jgi:plasmid stabilization system protein ParE
MKVRFTKRAARDIAEIADHIAAENPNAALAVRSSILSSLESISSFPQIGRAQNLEGVRKLLVRRYPYLIYYTFNEAAEEVIVLTIRHGARGPEYSDR